jgi:hypothetical protein
MEPDRDDAHIGGVERADENLREVHGLAFRMVRSHLDAKFHEGTPAAWTHSPAAAAMHMMLRDEQECSRHPLVTQPSGTLDYLSIVLSAKTVSE